MCLSKVEKAYCIVADYDTLKVLVLVAWESAVWNSILRQISKIYVKDYSKNKAQFTTKLYMNVIVCNCISLTPASLHEK